MTAWLVDDTMHAPNCGRDPSGTTPNMYNADEHIKPRRECMKNVCWYFLMLTNLDVSMICKVVQTALCCTVERN